MDAATIALYLTQIQSLMNYLVGRGLTRDRIQAILDEFEGEDIPTETVQTELTALGVELDETGRLIDENSN